MILIESAAAACYCGCYTTRLQLLNAAAIADQPQSLRLLATPAAFWQHLADEQPEWVVLTSEQLVREPELAPAIRKAYPSIGIVLCVPPDSPAPVLLWPLLLRL